MIQDRRNTKVLSCYLNEFYSCGASGIEEELGECAAKLDRTRSLYLLGWNFLF